MSLLEDHSASFIVRIWRERGDGQAVSQEWRGSIEHVQSGKRSFFRDLGAIARFMRPHLEQLGIEAPMRFWEVMTSDLFESPDTAAQPAEPPEPLPVRAAGRRKR